MNVRTGALATSLAVLLAGCGSSEQPAKPDPVPTLAPTPAEKTQ